MALEDLDAVLIGAFLDHLERERRNSVRTRNTRLAAVHSLFAYAALRHPEHAALIQRVLAIPAKRTDRQLVSFLTRDEVDALLAAPDRGTWIGRRDHAPSGGLCRVVTAATRNCPVAATRLPGGRPQQALDDDEDNRDNMRPPRRGDRGEPGHASGLEAGQSPRMHPTTLNQEQSVPESLRHRRTSPVKRADPWPHPSRSKSRTPDPGHPRRPRRHASLGGSRHGPYYQWSRAVAGKTVSRRLDEREAELYRHWIANRRRLEQIIAMMEQTSAAAAELLLRQTDTPRPPRPAKR